MRAARAISCRILRFLEADAVFANEVRNAARRVDLVIQTAFLAGLSQDDLDAVFQSFLDDHDPRHARIG
jgi:hypothetical protein